MLSAFPTEPVTLVKRNGQRIPVAEALVSSKSVHIDDASLPIEEGDVLERSLPNGLVEQFEVTDRGFYKAWGAFPDHY